MSIPPVLGARRGAWVAVGVSVAAGATWLAVTNHALPRTKDDAAYRAAGPAQRAEPAGAGALFADLTAEIGPAAAASQPLLFGPPDPKLTRWMRCKEDRRFAPVPANPTGGPGARLLAQLNTRPQSVSDLYRWQQTTVRDYVTRLRPQNRAVRDRIERLAATAGKLAADLHARTDWPAGLLPAADVPGGHWLADCHRRLSQAVSRRDLPAARRWADELSAALWGLADLHRWLDLLLENHLASLDFQVRCEGAIRWADPLVGSRAAYQIDDYPGASMIVARITNYLEVERQAARIFRPPAGRIAAALARAPESRAAMWMPPELRESFEVIRSRLAPATRRVWDEAASTPFEHSYLANMLFRASNGRVLDQLSVAMRRFERSGRPATVSSLMDVLFYRGGAWTSSLHADDRFDGRLMRTAGRLSGSDAEVLRSVQRRTHDMLEGWRNYRGSIWTIREALDQRVFDCVRGTDILGSLYRNAGRSGCYVVRLTCGIAGHTLLGARIQHDGHREIVLADPLKAPGAEAVWPEACFGGITWPEGYPGPRGPAFAAKLAARGLDNYLFVEGYIVRGPHAGELVKAAIPYLPAHETAGISKVFAGPYPTAQPKVRPPSRPVAAASRAGR